MIGVKVSTIDSENCKLRQNKMIDQESLIIRVVDMNCRFQDDRRKRMIILKTYLTRIEKTAIGIMTLFLLNHQHSIKSRKEAIWWIHCLIRLGILTLMSPE